MSDQPVLWLGNRNPSIAETITSGGSAVDLTGATVTFGMRPVNGTAIALGSTAVVVDPTAGEVQYDWAAADVDTAGQYLIWWRVTVGSKTQDMNEALIEIRDHAPETLPAYVELAELKSTQELNLHAFADLDLRRALLTASRGIDAACGRRFYLDPTNLSVRLYRSESANRVMIDDLVELTSLKIDRNRDGVFEETWTTAVDYSLEPLNAAADGRPYESICARPVTSRVFPTYWGETTVQVTGRFGWPSVPEPIKMATSILATKLVKRSREAPFGIVTVGGGMDSASAMRIAKYDPDVAPIIAAYSRGAPFA